VKYFVTIRGDSMVLELEELPDGSFRARGPDGEHMVDYVETTPHEASVRIDGRSLTYWYSDKNGTTSVSDARSRFDVQVLDERARLEASIFGKKLGGRGAGEVRSIMPGIVTRVFVKEGDAVEPGMPLLCIEAMKMENEIRADARGIVRRILASAGKTVNAGDPLVDLGA